MNIEKVKQLGELFDLEGKLRNHSSADFNEVHALVMKEAKRLALEIMQEDQPEYQSRPYPGQSIEREVPNDPANSPNTRPNVGGQT